MPGLVLLLAAVYLAACLYRPMPPFKSRQEVVRYGISALAVAVLLFSVVIPPPNDESDENIEIGLEQPAPVPQPTPEELSRLQQEELAQRRLNKIRGREEERLDAQMRDAARLQAPQPPAQ